MILCEPHVRLRSTGSTSLPCLSRAHHRGLSSARITPPCAPSAFIFTSSLASSSRQNSVKGSPILGADVLRGFVFILGLYGDVNSHHLCAAQLLPGRDWR